VTEWFEAFNALPLAGLMLVVALGYTLGRVSLRDISTGPGGATLLVALGLGYLGLDAGVGPRVAGSFGVGALGFALFIYSVGFDAAPHFFSSLRDRRGLRFVAVAVVVNVIAVILALGASRWLGMDASSTAGLLAGSLTSSPTYAAAAEVAPDPAQLSLAFAITYPFGLLGLVVLIQLVPRILGVDLAGDSVSEDEVPLDSRGRGLRSSGPTPEVSRAFEARREEVVGHSLAELDLTRRTGCVISRIRQGDQLHIPSGETVLEQGDRMMVTGRLDELREFQALVGPEIDATTFHSDQLPTRRIQVMHRDCTGQSLAELGILRRLHCVVTRVERGAFWIEPNADVTLARGDTLEVVGERGDLRRLARELGRFELPMNETDIAVYAGGILLGVLLGSIHLRPFGLDLTLGMSGGLLLVGLVLGAQKQIGPFRTHVPREARQLVRELGILLFMAQTGLDSGAQLRDEVVAGQWRVFVAGLGVSTLTVGAALVIARVGLRLRPVDAWGSICGGLTSAAALHAVRRAADSNEPAIAYATAYAVGSVLATVAGPLVVVWLR
jgi:putative transport protein